MQVTWSDTESCQSTEKESNASEECTNFTTFMASVIDEPLKKKALSESCESSDSNGDEMSFDSAYETLYKECLSLKQEQVEWKTSKRRVVPKKIPLELKLHCTHYTKMGHTVDRCYARMFESFQRKLTNLMNESFTLRNRLLQEGKRVFKRNSNVPHHITNVKRIWVKKNELNCLVVHTTLRASESHSWYFDSGCSRHMTGNRSFFTNFTKFDGGNMTFGDNNVASVKGKDTICAPRIPNLEEVLYVERLKANLINISQICDKKFNVQFSKNLCKVFDLNGNCVMIGLRTSDNCYVVCQNPSISSSSSSIVCGSSKVESINLWHRRLGHLNYRDLMKVAHNEVIKEIPKLGKPSNPICAINTACYTSNRTHMRSHTKKTCYELLKGKKPSMNYFRVFGSRCYVLKDHENLGKFESKSEEWMFLGHFSKIWAYRVYILSSKCMVESINVIVDDLGSRLREYDEDRIDVSKDIEVIEEKFEDENLSEGEEKKEEQGKKEDKGDN
ncbi:hypothetical protein AAG906_017383 [Vitis piasezkii]